MGTLLHGTRARGQAKGMGVCGEFNVILLGFKLPKRNTTAIPPVCVRPQSGNGAGSRQQGQYGNGEWSSND